MLSKLYLVAGAFLMVGYLAIETKGVVFSTTDSKPSLYRARSRSSGGGSSSSRRRGGGGFFWGGGYRGGK